MSTTATAVHQSGAFKTGDKVKVVAKIPTAKNWGDNWGSADMDSTVGQTGEVVSDGTQGVKVRFSGGRSWFYPSCALQLVGNVTTPAISPAPSQKTSKRVRVKPGPWDAAPCTHLRWQLMGFFREKLAVVRTDSLSSVDIACTKCNTKMTLKAK
jgi:hypothetical protein